MVLNWRFVPVLYCWELIWRLLKLCLNLPFFLLKALRIYAITFSMMQNSYSWTSLRFQHNRHRTDTREWLQNHISMLHMFPKLSYSAPITSALSFLNSSLLVEDFMVCTDIIMDNRIFVPWDFFLIHLKSSYFNKFIYVGLPPRLLLYSS